jgi:hypothetical protein
MIRNGRLGSSVKMVRVGLQIAGAAVWRECAGPHPPALTADRRTLMSTCSDRATTWSKTLRLRELFDIGHPQLADLRRFWLVHSASATPHSAMFFSVEPARDRRPRFLPTPLAPDPHFALRGNRSRGWNGTGFGGRLIDIDKPCVTVSSCLPRSVSCRRLRSPTTGPRSRGGSLCTAKCRFWDADRRLAFGEHWSPDERYPGSVSGLVEKNEFVSEPTSPITSPITSVVC